MTNICFGDPTKANIGAVLDDGIAGAAKIHINVAAVMHAELATGNHHDATFNAGDVGRTIDLATD